MDVIPQLIIYSIVSGSVYGLISIGFNFIFSVTKFFDMSYGAIIAVGGYVLLFVLSKTALPFSLSILIVILFTSFLGFLINKIVYQKLSNKNASNTTNLLASIGVMISIQAIISIIFTSQFQSLSILLGIQKIYNIYGVLITQIQLVIILTVFALSTLMLGVLKFTKYGKVFRAISDDKEVAKIVGIDTKKFTSKIFTVVYGLAGFIGILVILNFGMFPTIGIGLFLKGAIAAIIGGAGGIFAGVVGGMILGLIENLALWNFPGQWKDFIIFAIFIIFLSFKNRRFLKIN